MARRAPPNRCPHKSDLPGCGRGFFLLANQARPSQTLGAHDGVILVPVGYQADDKSPGERAGSGKVHSKLEMTRAILRHGLAHTCVLGATLAQDLIANP
jgi:hypothetical protein